MQDVLKGQYEINKSSTDKESADAVVQVFARSPKKSFRQFSREIGIEKPGAHKILRARTWKEALHSDTYPALHEDDRERRLQFCEWFLHKCDEREDFQDSYCLVT